MSLWLRVRCRECGYKMQRLVDAVPAKPGEPIPRAFCSACGRLALFVVSADDLAPKKGRKRSKTPMEADEGLRWALIDADLERS